MVSTWQHPEAGVKERTSYVKIKSADGVPENILYVVDGIVQEKLDPTTIDPRKIESMSVYKGDAATKKYGEKGKNGVVEINLKK